MLQGEWCSACGQRQKPVDRFLLSLVAEAFDDVFSWDSRAGRTIVAVLFRPGFLAREYFAGRRARYVPPLRLYLIASVSFFFLMSVQSFLGFNQSQIQIYQADQAHEAEMTPAQREELRKDVDHAISDFNIAMFSAQTNQAIRDRLTAQTLKARELLKREPASLVNAVLNVAPPVLFMLVPIFAGFLKLAYLGSGRYYTEHLVLSVHNHSFLFLVFILGTAFSALGLIWSPIETLGQGVINLWIPVYMFLSLLTTYREGVIVTLLKFAFLSSIYIIVFGIGVAIAIVMGILTL